MRLPLAAEFSHHKGRVQRIALDSTGENLFSADDEAILQWDIRSNECRLVYATVR